METNTERPFTVCEARSYARCIQAGLTAAEEHAGTVLAHTWLTLLLSLLLPFPGLFIYAGQLDRLLHEWQQQGVMPRRKPLEGLAGDMRSTFRAALRLILSAVVIIAVVATTWAAGQSLPHGRWCALVIFIALTLALMPTTMVLMDIAYSTQPLSNCIGGVAIGYKHYGSLFPFQLLLFMLVLLVALPGQVPMGIMSAAWAHAYQAMQNGDIVDTPPIWVLATIAAYIASMAFMVIAMTVESFCSILFWGNIQTREAEKQKA